MEFYQITKEAMENQTMTREDVVQGHVYVWPTNGCVASTNMLIPYPLHHGNGTFRKWVGFIDATKYGLKKCSRNDAYNACWEFGEFRNKWDIYNNCYRENLTDRDGNSVEIRSMDNLKMATRLTEDQLLKYFHEEGYEVINK